MREIFILGVKINDLTATELEKKISEFLNNGKFNLIFTPNPEICLKAEKDDDYRNIINGADLSLPDGVGLKLGAQILGQKLEGRFTGADLVKSILAKINQVGGGKVFIITRKIPLSDLNLLKSVLQKKFPNIIIEGIEADEKELNKMIVQVKRFSPEIILAANGAPVQEQILMKLKREIKGVKIAMGVGGALDFITGVQKRAPKAMREHGLEWFYRLLKQPSRYRRITDATIRFPLKCYQWKIRMESKYRDNVVAVIKQGDKFLIQRNKRFNQEHWQFPQGGVDPPESLEDAVVREACEELGIESRLLKIKRKLPVEHAYDFPDFHKYIKGYKGQKQQFFLLEYLGKDSDFHFDDSPEVAEIRWVTKDDLFSFIHPKRQESLKKLFEYL